MSPTSYIILIKYGRGKDVLYSSSASLMSPTSVSASPSRLKPSAVPSECEDAMKIVGRYYFVKSSKKRTLGKAKSQIHNLE